MTHLVVRFLARSAVLMPPASPVPKPPRTPGLQVSPRHLYTLLREYKLCLAENMRRERSKDGELEDRSESMKLNECKFPRDTTLPQGSLSKRRKDPTHVRLIDEAFLIIKHKSKERAVN